MAGTVGKDRVVSRILNIMIILPFFLSGQFLSVVLDIMLSCSEYQDGMYGSGCTQHCGNCLKSVECDKTNGNCPGRCSAGYQGILCKQGCDDGTYGEDCVSQCGICYNDTGFDKMSDVEVSPSRMASCSIPVGIAIVGTAGTILLIEAFVGAVVYLIWKRRQGQADSSEHPYELRSGASQRQNDTNLCE